MVVQRSLLIFSKFSQVGIYSNIECYWYVAVSVFFGLVLALS